jgi:DNA-binding transcriptional regulator of glucitol operon
MRLVRAFLALLHIGGWQLRTFQQTDRIKRYAPHTGRVSCWRCFQEKV